MLPLARALRPSALLLLIATAVGAEPVSVRVKAVPLDASRPGRDRVGQLRYRGGLQLVSEHPRFGGLSAIRVLADGSRVAAVSDEGSWLSARLLLEAGRLTGLADVEMGPLLDPDGRPLAGKQAGDAESLALLPDGSFVVGFEQRHRLWRYPAGSGRPDGVPLPLPPPPGLELAPANGGVESLVDLPGRGLLALTEEWIEGDHLVGWIGGPEAWQRIGLRADTALRPSDAAVLPKGDLLVLERTYDTARRANTVRIRRVPGAAVRPGATLDGEIVARFEPPLAVDNDEGLAVFRRGGETLLLLVTDDNFNAAGGQRTLLLLFAIRP